MPVSLPVYVIHGNHDDPTGGPPNEALSALDVLEMAGLITYFGRARSSSKIQVAPVLLRKGNSGLALYGLGNIRDEALHHTWATLKAVSWLKPKYPHQRKAKASSQDTNPIPWFSLFALHQNRYTRGSSRGISETLLPKWIDYVVWGHEHESLPELTNSKPPIVQPGSTVATSLSISESGYKNAVMIEVCGGKLVSHKTVPLHTVREFAFHDVSLNELKGISQRDPKEKVERQLMKIVEQKLAKHTSLFDQKVDAFRKGIRSQVINGIVYPPHSFYLEKLTPLLRMPLIRLRVDISGSWNTPSPQGFGRNYEETIASPWDTLLYYRRRQNLPLKRSRTFLQGESSGPNVDAMELDNEEEVDFTRNQVDQKSVVHISKLLQHNLSRHHDGIPGLNFLEIDGLSGAVHQFVNNDETKAIGTYISEYISTTRKRTLEELIQNGRRVDEIELLEKFRRNATAAATRFMAESVQCKMDSNCLKDWKRLASSDSARRDAESLERLITRGRGTSRMSVITKPRTAEQVRTAVESEMPLVKFLSNEKEFARRALRTTGIKRLRFANEGSASASRGASIKENPIVSARQNKQEGPPVPHTEHDEKITPRRRGLMDSSSADGASRTGVGKRSSEANGDLRKHQSNNNDETESGNRAAASGSSATRRRASMVDQVPVTKKQIHERAGNSRSTTASPNDSSKWRGLNESFESDKGTKSSSCVSRIQGNGLTCTKGVNRMNSTNQITGVSKGSSDLKEKILAWGKNSTPSSSRTGPANKPTRVGSNAARSEGRSGDALRPTGTIFKQSRGGKGR